MANNTRSFGELFSTPPRNGLTRPKAIRGAGVKMVNMGELFGHPRLLNAPMDRVPLSQSEATRFLLQEGDLLFARQSLVLEGAGKCSIFLGDGEPVTFESHITRVRLDPNVGHPLFYFYYLQSHDGQAAIRSIVEQGAGASGIRGSDLSSIKVAWLPPEEQHAIAHILGTLDDKIELNRRMNETLEAMARALFKSWFVDFDPVHAKADAKRHGTSPDAALAKLGVTPAVAPLFPDSFTDSPLGPIPTGWQVGCLGDIAGNGRENVQPEDCKPDEPYIGLEHMPRKCIALGEWGRAEDVGSNKSRFARGDFLFGKLRPYFHKVGVAFVSGVCSTDILVVRPKDSAWRGLVLLTISSDDFVAYTNSASTGTKMPRTNWQDMAKYQVVLPDKTLCGLFTRIVAANLEKIERNVFESTALVATRDSLLPKLLSGDIAIGEVDKEIMEQAT